MKFKLQRAFADMKVTKSTLLPVSCTGCSDQFCCRPPASEGLSLGHIINPTGLFCSPGRLGAQGAQDVQANFTRHRTRLALFSLICWINSLTLPQPCAPRYWAVSSVPAVSARAQRALTVWDPQRKHPREAEPSAPVPSALWITLTARSYG